MKHKIVTALVLRVEYCYLNCNLCNYILITKFPLPGDSEGTFQAMRQAATCPPVYYLRWRLHTVPLIAERQAGKLEYQFLKSLV